MFSNAFGGGYSKELVTSFDIVKDECIGKL
jgi:hypothetical protein